MDIGIPKPLDVSRSPGVSMLSPQQLAPAPLKSAQNALDTSVKATGEEATQARPVEKEQLEVVVADMQDFVQSVSRDISFQLDDSSGRMVVNVTERNSGEVIRQIPSEEALQLAENLSEIRSLLFKAEA